MIASIEAPFVFFQEPIKTLLFYAIKFPHMAFGLIPKVLNPIDGFLALCK